MNRLPVILVGSALVLTFILYAATSDSMFGVHPKQANTATLSDTAAHSQDDGHNHGAPLSTDTILQRAKSTLTVDQQTRLALLEQSITRGDVAEQKIHLYHQIARWWADSAHLFEPYAWYTGEAARAENSEKSLTFAAHLFLGRLKTVEDEALRSWNAAQATDLFNRALQVNPASDSAQIGLGATLLYGGAASPMEGIGKIRAVAEKDSNNVYAQLTLGQASLISGQTEKAIERFKKVAAIDPQNLEALLSLADTYERLGKKDEAVLWYTRCLPLSAKTGLQGEIEKRIELLKKS